MATYDSMTLENRAGSHTVPVSSRDFFSLFPSKCLQSRKNNLVFCTQFLYVLTVNAR